MAKRFAGNSGKQQKRKPRGKPFRKGESGNPRGRPKLPDDVRAWLEANKGAMTVEALSALRNHFLHVKGDVAVRAQLGWLNKTLPDAAIAIELSGPSGTPIATSNLDYSKLTTEQLRQLRTLLAAAATDKPR